MEFPQLTIRQDEETKGKGRSFTVHQVAAVFAPQVVPEASNGTRRPVLLAYAATPSAVRAFTANLRCGECAATSRDRIELLRSHGYRYQLTTPASGQALALAYLPDLFHLQPGAQGEDRLRFISAPPAWWLDRQEHLLVGEFGSLARDHARAMAFVARLDARSPLPISNDPSFHFDLYQRALDEEWVATDDDVTVLSATGVERLGLDPPVLCDVSQDEFAEFLASATAELMDHDATADLASRATPSHQLALNFLTA